MTCFAKRVSCILDGKPLLVVLGPFRSNQSGVTSLTPLENHGMKYFLSYFHSLLSSFLAAWKGCQKATKYNAGDAKIETIWAPEGREDGRTNGELFVLVAEERGRMGYDRAPLGGGIEGH